MALGVCLGEWSTLRRRMTVMMFGRSERIRTSDPLVPNVEGRGFESIKNNEL
jgi:hypothetical protein